MRRHGVHIQTELTKTGQKVLVQDILVIYNLSKGVIILEELLKIFDKIIDSRVITDGEYEYYEIDVRKMLAIRELLRRKVEKQKKNK